MNVASGGTALEAGGQIIEHHDLLSGLEKGVNHVSYCCS